MMKDSHNQSSCQEMLPECNTGTTSIQDTYEFAKVHRQLADTLVMEPQRQNRSHTLNAFLAAVAVGGTLVAGSLVYALRHGNAPSAPTKAHAALTVPGVSPRQEAIPVGTIEQTFALSPIEIKSPDGHSVLITGSPLTNPMEEDLFLSTDNGKHAELVAENVDAAIWSPYVEQGQDPLFATLEHDKIGTDERVVLYRVGPNEGAQQIGDAVTAATRLEHSYDGKTETQMYDWQRVGNQVDFTVEVPTTGENTDGTSWTYNKPDATLITTI